MDEKILKILEGIQQDMGTMREQLSKIESDVLDVKLSVHRLETSQEESVLALLHNINEKVEVMHTRQEDTDRVVDILAARTTRLQASLNPSS